MEETNHFCAWRQRLEQEGYAFGDFETPGYLWDAAYNTRDSLRERLALVHLCFEARGLDVYPATREKIKNARDEASLSIIDNNVLEEVGHISKSVKWFRYVCEKEGVDPKLSFHQVVRSKYYGGKLPGDFNLAMRDEAGMPRDWYEPLTQEEEGKEEENAA